MTVDYVWTNNANLEPAPGTGTIVSSEKAKLTYNPVPDPQNPNADGACTFENAPVTDTYPGLKTKQYTPPMGTPQSTTYFLRAIPYSIRGGTYTDANQKTVFCTRRLGAIQ